MSRKPLSIITIVLSLFFLAGISLYVSGEMPHRNYGDNEKKAATPTHATVVSSAPVASTKTNPANLTPVVAPPGTELHVIAKGETIPGLLRSTLPRTRYMTVPEFESALRQQNPTLKGLFQAWHYRVHPWRGTTTD